ncbi:hypothetical protein BH09MYX1_BH09MYX1_55060 [soil metagenome]
MGNTTATGAEDGVPRTCSIVFGLTAVLMAGTFAFVDLGGDDLGPFNHSPIIVPGCAFGLVVIAIYLGWATRREARLARAMLDAAPHVIPWEHNTWGATEGTIASGSKSLEIEAAAFSLFEETYNDGSGGNHEAWTSEGGPFVLDADGIATMRVQAAKAEWGTTARWEKPGRPKATADRPKVVRAVGVLPVGGRVLVVGRVKVQDGMAEMTSTGAESLLLFATEHGSPRTVLRALLRQRALIVLALVLLATAELGLFLSGALGVTHSGSGGD